MMVQKGESPTMPEQDQLTLYNLHGCPYCAIVRLRLGQLGLGYILREQPQSRPERKEVIAVSGQQTVPVLVISRAGQPDEVLSDENDILRYLDERYAPRPAVEDSEPWSDADGRALKSAAENLADLGQQLQELAQGAAASGEIDRSNVLMAAAGHVSMAQRWAANQLQDS